MVFKKLHKGGSNNDNTIKMFITIVILGYFGIKIVYAFFFGYYPDKFYNRDIQINSNQSDSNNVKDIVVNAYVPGLWNTEITDFITTVVLCFIIYIFTNLSTKHFINSYGNIELSFLLGYIIGLGYPPIYTFYLNRMNVNDDSSNKIFNNIYFSIAIIFVIFSIIINFSGTTGNSSYFLNYTTYLITFFLVMFGLIVSRKVTKNYTSVTYFYNNGENCTFSKNGVIQSSGDRINITVPFLSFIILLLFSYEPTNLSLKNLYIFSYALLLGILVSGISYFGIEYFLIKHPQKQCNNIQDCIIRDMNMSNKNNLSDDTYEESLNDVNKYSRNLRDKLKNNNLSDDNNKESLNDLNKNIIHLKDKLKNNNLSDENYKETLNELNNYTQKYNILKNHIYSEVMDEELLDDLKDKHLDINIKNKHKKFSIIKFIILIIIILLAIYLIYINFYK